MRLLALTFASYDYMLLPIPIAGAYSCLSIDNMHEEHSVLGLLKLRNMDIVDLAIA